MKRSILFSYTVYKSTKLVITCTLLQGRCPGSIDNRKTHFKSFLVAVVPFYQIITRFNDKIIDLRCDFRNIYSETYKVLVLCFFYCDFPTKICKMRRKGAMTFNNYLISTLIKSNNLSRVNENADILYFETEKWDVFLNMSICLNQEFTTMSQ